jgi:MFS family permease
VSRSATENIDVSGTAKSSFVLERALAPTLPFAVSLLVLFFAYWCVDIVSPALPTIKDSLSLSATGAGLVFSVFFAGRLVTNLPAAWLVERTGPKWTAAIGAAILLVGSLFAAIANSEAMLLPARGLQGVGVAILATAGLLSVLRARPQGGAAMTAFNVSSGVGGSFGLLSGGYLSDEIGWRAVFWLSAIVSAVLLLTTLLARTQAALTRPVRTDFAEPLPATMGAVSAAVALNFLVFANYAIWIVSLPLLGVAKFGFNPGQVALMLLFVNVVHLVSAVPVGVFIRKAGATRSLMFGLGIVGIGMVLTPMASSITWLAIPMALYAIGQVAGNSSAGDLILRLGGGGGRAVGAVRLSSDVGLVVGPAAAGVLTDAAGVDASFTVLGVMTFAAMAGSAGMYWHTRSRAYA